MTRKRKDTPEIIHDLTDLLSDAFTRQGIGPLTARKLSLEISKRIQAHWGGQQIYIPRAFSMRDVEIFVQYRDGEATRSDLCRKYGISVQRFYQIIHAINNTGGVNTDRHPD